MNAVSVNFQSYFRKKESNSNKYMKSHDKKGEKLLKLLSLNI